MRGGLAALRVALPIVVVLALAAALYPASRPVQIGSDLAEFLPAQARSDTIEQSPDGGIYQSTQALRPARGSYLDLTPGTRKALGYGNDLDAPELQGHWLVVDVLPPQGCGDLRTTSFHVAENEVTQQATETADNWLAFSPGLPVLGTDLLDGATVDWTGVMTYAGNGGDPVEYGATARVTTEVLPSVRGCYETTARVRFDDSSTQTRTTIFCSGDAPGWAGESLTVPGSETASQRTDRSITEKVTSAPVVAAQPDAVDGSIADAVFYRAVNATYQEVGPLIGPRHLAMAGDDLVLAQHDGIVTRWQPADSGHDAESARTLRWRATPGGSVTALETSGDVTLVGTTADAVTGYSAHGIRLWRVGTADVVTSIAATGDAAVVVDARGLVRLVDTATGKPRWTRAFSPDAAVAVGADHVVVRSDDALTVLDAASGRQLWTRTFSDGTPQDDVAVVGDVVVTQVDGWLVARAADDGRVRWTRAIDPWSTVTASNDQLLVLGTSSAEAVGPDGRMRWSADPTPVAHQSGRSVALAYTDHVELWDDGRRIGTWEYPDGVTRPTSGIAITGRGALLYQTGTGEARWTEYR